MRTHRVGYACINQTLGGNCDRTYSETGNRCGSCHKCLGGKPKTKVYTNRTCIRRTFDIDTVAQKIEHNLTDLLTILRWNEQHSIRFMRLSSEMFPFMSHEELGYDPTDLPNADTVLSLLTQIGDYARTHDHRLTFHPGPFNVLGSTNPATVVRTIADLNAHSRIFDLMGFEPSHFNKINIHIGSGADDHDATIARFINNFARLDPNCRRRLTLENDDKARMYSVSDLMAVYNATGIPIVFDYHHHQFCTGGLSESEALALAVSTWPEGITPVVHYSESRTLEQGGDHATPAHSDLCHGPMHLYGQAVDVMIESKAKELSLATLTIVPE
tara:strand:+ start:1852 stop:2838 length:987 start_codon:yes stop_codon:yes gene_type:complete